MIFSGFTYSYTVSHDAVDFGISPDGVSSQAMSRERAYKVPKLIRTCPHCGFAHSAADLLRVDGDTFQCKQCGKPFPSGPGEATWGNGHFLVRPVGFHASKPQFHNQVDFEIQSNFGVVVLIELGKSHSGSQFG